VLCGFQNVETTVTLCFASAVNDDGVYYGAYDFPDEPFDFSLMVDTHSHRLKIKVNDEDWEDWEDPQKEENNEGSGCVVLHDGPFEMRRELGPYDKLS
jgi:hypothetical protein